VGTSTEHTALDLLNTSAQRTHVGYTLYSQTGDTSRGTLTVGAHAARVVPVAGLTPLRGSFGLALRTDRPLAAQLRLMRQGRDGHGHDYGLTTRLGTTTPARLWLLAQGTPLPHGQTYLTILNPTTRTAHVTVRFYGSSGRLVGSRTIRLNGPGQAQIALPSAG